MAYSDSMHFYDKLSYKIPFIFELWIKIYEFSKICIFAGILGNREKITRAKSGPDLRLQIAAVARRQWTTPVGNGPRPIGTGSEQQK
jgi:hypothetical protein